MNIFIRMPRFLKQFDFRKEIFYNRCARLIKWKNTMQQKWEITAAAFLDLTKAFDSINHELMTQKLSILGFSIPHR